MRRPKRRRPAVILPVQLTELSNRELLIQLMVHGEVLGRAKKELSRRLGTMSDQDVEWLATDQVARGSTWGGMVFGTDEYTHRLISVQNALKEKLRLLYPQGK